MKDTGDVKPSNISKIKYYYIWVDVFNVWSVYSYEPHFVELSEQASLQLPV